MAKNFIKRNRIVFSSRWSKVECALAEDIDWW